MEITTLAFGHAGIGALVTGDIDGVERVAPGGLQTATVTGLDI